MIIRKAIISLINIIFYSMLPWPRVSTPPPLFCSLHSHSEYSGVYTWRRYCYIAGVKVTPGTPVTDIPKVDNTDMVGNYYHWFCHYIYKGLFFPAVCIHWCVIRYRNKIQIYYVLVQSVHEEIICQKKRGGGDVGNCKNMDHSWCP